MGTKIKENPDDELQTGIGVAESTDERGMEFNRMSFESRPGTGVTKSWLV